MTTALTTIENVSNKEIMEMTGQAEANSLPFSFLNINKEAEDDEGNTLPVGSFRVSTPKGFVYSKTCSFRPFLNVFQYSVYDQEKEEYSSVSVFFKTFFQKEIPDSTGTFKCGKISGPAKEALTEDEKADQSRIRCARFLYGVVSMEGVTKTGEKLEVKEQLVQLKLTGVNFLPMGDIIKSISQKKQLMLNTNINLSLKKDKKGSNVFYHIVPEVSWEQKIPFTQSGEGCNLDMLRSVDQYITSMNEKITGDWHKARGLDKPVDAEFAEVAKEVLEHPFDDSIEDLKAA